MFELEIKTQDSSGNLFTLDKILEQLNHPTRNGSFYATFAPSCNLPLALVKELLPKLPKQCLGLNLSSLIKISPMTRIDEFSEVCLLIPTHLQVLDASFIVPENSTPTLVSLFFKTVPKTSYLILKGNSLYQLSTSDLTELNRVDTLDLRYNEWHRDWPKEHFNLFKSLPKNVTSLYIDLKEIGGHSNNELSLMREHFFKSLPPTIHTLGLTALDFKQSEHTLINLPTHVTSLKWFEGCATTPEAIISATPQTIKTLDLSKWQFGLYPITWALKYVQAIPKQVSTLILDNNQLSQWPLEDLIFFISQIPETVSSVHLQNNQLFTGKSINQYESLLQGLQPYNHNDRFILKDNGWNHLLMAMPSLINAVNNQILNEDTANYLSLYLGAQSTTFFSEQRKKVRCLTKNYVKNPML